MPRDVQAYFERVRDAISAHPEWRVGQTYFNVLHDMHPNLANEIRATSADPFHDDRIIPSFLNWTFAELYEM